MFAATIQGQVARGSCVHLVARCGYTPLELCPFLEGPVKMELDVSPCGDGHSSCHPASFVVVVSDTWGGSKSLQVQVWPWFFKKTHDLFLSCDSSLVL